MVRPIVVLVALLAAVAGAACDRTPDGASAGDEPVTGVELDVPDGFELPPDGSSPRVAVGAAQWLGPADPRTGLRSGVSIHVFCDERPLRQRAADHGALRQPLPLQVDTIGAIHAADVRGADEAIRFDVARSGESSRSDERHEVRSQELLAAAGGRTIHVIVASPLGDLASGVSLPEDQGRAVLSSVRLDRGRLATC